MPNDNLSRCLSALIRHEDGLCFAAEEMRSYGVLDDFQESFRRSGKLPGDAARAIIAEHGFSSPIELELVCCDRLGIKAWVEQDDDGLDRVRTEGMNYAQFQMLSVIPPTREQSQLNEMMAATP